jgi:hypothetical protein
MTGGASADPGEAATALRRMLVMLDEDEMTASSAVRYRLEGAVIALEALAQGKAPTVDDIIGPESDQ